MPVVETDPRVAAAMPLPPDVPVLGVDRLIRLRAASKSKVTLTLKKLNASSIDSSDVKLFVDTVHGLLDQIGNYDSQINELENPLWSVLEDQLDYTLDVKRKLNASNSLTTNSSVRRPEVKLPALKCAVFRGEGASSLEYSNFLQQFQNVIGSRGCLADSAKLTYLKTYLDGYALKVINHLSIANENYEVALSMLEKEFLDRDALTCDLINKLFNLKPSFHQEYLNT